jgi:pectate lyase
MYNFFRSNGFTEANLVTLNQGHDKTHLAGPNDLDPANNDISITFHHEWLINTWDRCVPRLRGGNVHDYDIYADVSGAYAAKQMRDSLVAAMSTANQNTANNTYHMEPPLNGSISTEGGALLVEKSVYIDTLTPLRNNQTDVTNPAYTGKIEALDTIYTNPATGTTVRGNSTDPGSQLGPFQAPVIPFSWNSPYSSVPYAYTTTDPASLLSVLQAGAGAGVINLTQAQWMQTSY